MKYLLSLVTLLFISSCIEKQDSPVTYSKYLMSPGDLVVTNGGINGNKSVVLLDSNGNFKATLIDLLPAESPMGLAWKDDTREVLITVDSTADRVLGVSAYDGSVDDFINDIGNLTGTLYGIAVLADGTVKISETSNVENYSAGGVRIVAGAWPKALMTTGSNLNPHSAGGFVYCSSGTDQVRIYDAAGVQTATTTGSGIGGTTDTFGCFELSDGTVAVAWNGTTDTIQIRSSNLSTTVASFSNTSIMGNPRGIAEATNGNILIVDLTANHIVEITKAGSLVRTFAGSHLSSPVDILVIPDYFQ